jgi:hypothetical protein
MINAVRCEVRDDAMGIILSADPCRQFQPDRKGVSKYVVYV